jgi:hypothetical protein
MHSMERHASPASRAALHAALAALDVLRAQEEGDHG